MRKVELVVLLRFFLLVALAASAALYVEYQNAGDPAFCGVGSGCLAVRLSPFSRFFGVPLPTIGLAAFAGLFILSVASQSRAQLRVLAVLNGIGALTACGLIYLQAFEIRAFCPWCVAVDVSAILAAVCSSLLYGQVDDEQKAGKGASAELAALSRLPIALAWVLAAAGAIGVPFLWGQYPVIPKLPPEIAALQVPGKITIVSFTDFECPFCRALHPVMEQIVEAHPDRVAVVRRMMPLSSHPGAMPAALVYACTPEAKRPQIVDALYATPEPLLTREGTLGVAAGLGMNREELARCVDSPEARAQVDKDIKLFTDLQGQALPLTYAGDRVILGFNPDRLKSAIELALQGEHPSLPVAWMFVALGVIFAAAVGVTLRFGPRR
jgi:uncharacterized membrane protein